MGVNYGTLSLKDIQILETIQCRAARWVCGSRWDPSVFSWTKSYDQCLNLLGWPSLILRHDYLSVNLLYDINSKIAIKFSDFSLYPLKTRQYSLSIFPLQTTINSLRYSFFGDVPFIWNKIPFEILSLTDHNPFHCAVKLYFFGTVCFVLCVCSLCSVFLYTFICNLAIYLYFSFVCVCVWGSTLVQA